MTDDSMVNFLMSDQFVVLIVILFIAVFALALFFSIRHMNKMMDIHGKRDNGTAVIQSVLETGKYDKNKPVLELELVVATPKDEKFSAKVRQAVDPHDVLDLQPGVSVNASYNYKNHKHVRLELMDKSALDRLIGRKAGSTGAPPASAPAGASFAGNKNFDFLINQAPPEQRQQAAQNVAAYREMYDKPADPAEEIRKLAELRDSGILTEDEFAAKKKQLLGI